MSYLRIRVRVETAAVPNRGGRGGGADVGAARALYRRFNRFEPTATLRTRCRRQIPPVLVRLGELRGVIYRSDKWQRGRPRTYVHFMENPPILASDPQGGQLYILGGSYKVTERGIEG